MTRWPLFILFILLIMFIVVLFLTSSNSESSAHNRRTSPIAPHDARFVCISLPIRKDKYFEGLKKDLHEEGLTLDYHQGVNGKEIDFRQYPLGKLYRAFFEKNEKERNEGMTKTNYTGHLACTLAHLEVIREVTDSITVVMEDDILPEPGFRNKFELLVSALNEYDPTWDVLLLGFCCNYKDHPHCRSNDHEPIHPGGFVKVHFWIGGWAYAVKNKVSAQKILSEFEPSFPWHIDLTMANMAKEGRLNVYGAMPTIANHAGYLKVSSYAFTQYGDYHKRPIKSDTNN